MIIYWWQEAYQICISRYHDEPLSFYPHSYHMGWIYTQIQQNWSYSYGQLYIFKLSLVSVFHNFISLILIERPVLVNLFIVLCIVFLVAFHNTQRGLVYECSLFHICSEVTIVYLTQGMIWIFATNNVADVKTPFLLQHWMQNSAHPCIHLCACTSLVAITCPHFSTCISWDIMIVT